MNRFWLFFSIFGLLAVRIYAQQRNTIPGYSDTASFSSKMKAISKFAEKKGSEELAADKTAIEQYRILEQVLHTVQNAKTYLKTIGTTDSVDGIIEMIDRNYHIAINGILINKPEVQTFRNLTASISILQELHEIVASRKNTLEAQRRQLTLFRYQLDSLLTLSPLFTFHDDSVSFVRYIRELTTINKQIHPVDSLLDLTSHNAQSHIIETNARLTLLIDGIEEMYRQRNMIASHLLDREIPGIAGNFQTGISLQMAVKEAVDKGKVTLLFYVGNNKGRIWIGLLLWLTIAFYLRSLNRSSQARTISTNAKGGRLVLQHPAWSSLLLVCSLYQFVFLSPPFMFRAGIWLIASIALTVVVYNHINHYWRRIWLTIVILSGIGVLLNLLLRPSQAELYLLCAVSIAGIVTGLSALTRGPRKELREQWILFPIGIMAVLETVALLACLSGRYNFSKSLMIMGFLSALIAIHFLWVVRIVNDWLLMASQWYRQQNRKFLYLNPDKIGQRAPFIFYFLLIIGWAWLIGKNFPGFDHFIEPVNTFFSIERSIGEYHFSISNVLLFIAIMVTAVIVSRIVSFFTSDQLPRTHSPLQKMQSWLLLVRISIICMGLFLAVAATGIPLDRLTIVLGALSVGVGFGLQALVNNLVSGLIIAFERPVHVGDHVDIDGQVGVMKSIGFRSSVIYTQEGADMIIPNGDLLNAHLINWSLGGNRKRIKISFQAPFDTNIEQVKELVNTALQKDERILRNPAPGVQFEQIRNGVIEVVIYFWPQNLEQGPQAQSDLIELLINLFKQNGLSFPLPRHEIFVHSDDSNTDKEA